MKLPFLRALALITAVMMAAVIVFGSRNDTRARIAQAEEMMTAQGNAIADIVAESSRHGLEVYTKWEAEAQKHLLDNANWLAWVNTQRNLSTGDLNKFAQDLDLWRIFFFNPAGGLEKSSHPQSGSEPGVGQISPGFLSPLVSGKQKTGVMGFRNARKDDQPRLVVGVTRSGGGAVIVSSRAVQMDLACFELSPGHLIKALGQAQGMNYVVLQDRTGIIAASTSAVEFNLPEDDPALQPLTEGARYVARRFTSELGPVLEVARVLPLGSSQTGGKSVLLRVGLDATLLDELGTDTRKRSVLRVLLMIGSLILLSILLLAWQRQGILRREVNKVTWELRTREEEARRSGKFVAMGNLAAGVAHEIRNPLNTIHMIAQSLGRDQDLPEEVSVQSRHIRDESARIESIVQQFLDFARPREPVFERLDLGLLVRETVAVHQAAHTGGEIVFKVETCSCEAELDRQFVIEIVENLVRNAADALAGRGTIAVSFNCRREMAELVVEDDGPGVPTESREKIFDLYYTTKSSGHGLGLSLVSRMVSALSGHFSLDQENNGLGGARFVIQLPLQRSKQ